MHLACMLEILPGWLSESLSLYSGQAVANLGWMLAIPIILLMLATPMYIVIWCYMVVSYGTCPPRICRGFSMTLWEASHRPRRWTHTSWSCSGVWLGWDGGRSRVPKGFSVTISIEWAFLPRGSEASPGDLADLYCTAMDDGWLFFNIFLRRWFYRS